MYALLLPSAHFFISATDENVNVELWQTSVATGPPTPCRFGSPACTARVCNPGRLSAPPRNFLPLCKTRVFFIIRRLFAPSLRRGNHQLGAPALIGVRRFILSACAKGLT